MPNCHLLGVNRVKCIWMWKYTLFLAFSLNLFPCTDKKNNFVHQVFILGVGCYFGHAHALSCIALCQPMELILISKLSTVQLRPHPYWESMILVPIQGISVKETFLYFTFEDFTCIRCNTKNKITSKFHIGLKTSPFNELSLNLSPLCKLKILCWGVSTMKNKL